MGQLQNKVNWHMRTITVAHDNVGGVHRVVLINVNNVETIVTHGINADLVVNRIQEMIELPVEANDTFVFDENCLASEAGKCWDVKIQGFVPTSVDENRAIIDELVSNQWLALLTDNNGSYRLAGDQEVPLTFTYNYSTGQLAGRNGFSVNLSARLSHRSYFMLEQF